MMKRLLLLHPRVFYLFLGFFILCSAASFGQANVHGVLKDSLTGEALIAANVTIKGTTIGTVTDYNGKYNLFLNEGTYVIQFSYLGYQTREATVTIKDQDMEINKALPLESVMGEEIVISAQARGQLAAVNRQLNSDKIMSAVSAERIKEFPDNDAAQSVSRLPGVHLDGSNVVIRGIEPKMNKILINGVEMPSTSGTDRTSSLGMVSSNMLSGIEVFKTVTPDMDADAIGGVVNLRLQEATPGAKFSVLAQGNYNAFQQSQSGKIWADYSNRFFNDKIGLAVNGNYSTGEGGYDEVDGNYLNYNDIANSDDDDYYIENVNIVDRISTGTDWGGNLILDYKIGNGKIIYNSMFSSGTSNTLTNKEVLDVQNAVEKGVQLNIDHTDNTDQLWSHLLQIDQQIGRFKINGAASYITYKKDPNYDYDINWASKTGSNALTNISELEDSEREALYPLDIYDYVNDTVYNSIKLQSYNLTPTSYNDKRINVSADIEASVMSSDNFDVTLKFGGKYKQTYREYDADKYACSNDIVSFEEVQEDFADYLAEQGQEDYAAALKYPYFRDYDYKTNDNFMNGEGYHMDYFVDADKTDKIATELLDKDKLANTSSSYKDDYWGSERLYAAYLMGQFKIYKRLTIITGVRFESMNYDYNALKTSIQSKGNYSVEDTLSVPTTHNNILPHFHAKLKATNWMDVRFSYNQTITRPDYKFMIPKIFIDNVNSEAYCGNPYLENALSNNFDLNVSLHSGKLGLVTVGGYNKSIENIFYEKDALIKNIPDEEVLSQLPSSTYSNTTTYYVNNENKAFIRGAELEWQSNLSFLPFPFNGLVINANYTHVWSQTDYPLFQIETVRLNEDPWIAVVESDTVFTQRLIKQANDLGNISVGYDYKGFSARLSFQFHGNELKSLSSYVAENEYTNSTYKFDLALKQQIPIKFARMEAYFNATNFTNQPYSTYCTYPNIGTRTQRLRYSGASYQLGIRIRNKI